MRYSSAFAALVLACFAAPASYGQFTIPGLEAPEETQAAPPAPPTREISPEEQESLQQALQQAQTSPQDLIRALEAHLKRYPNSAQKSDLEYQIARAAIEADDVPRIAEYGPAALAVTPEDVLILDRVTRSLLLVGGKQNADSAYRYARRFEELLSNYNIEPGPKAIQRQEERDRALGRVLLYQSRARTTTGENDEAVRLAARSFAAYPDEASAREWAETLNRQGKREEAIEKMAEAFAIPDPRAQPDSRLDDRIVLGEWYTGEHGSETGLGDKILEAYDRTSRIVETRQKKLMALDPNAAARNPMEFTLTGLDGKRMRLASLLGKVVVMDFWATWCVPCRAQHPLYEQLKEKFAGRDVVFLAVNADEDHDVVEPFLEAQGWDKDVYFEDGLARLLSVVNIPTTILFDREGTLASRMDGFSPDSFVDLMTARIEEELGDKSSGDEPATADVATTAAETTPAR